MPADRDAELTSPTKVPLSSLSRAPRRHSLSNVLRHIHVEQPSMVHVQDAAAQHADSMGSDEQKQAAQMIQRNYRGYRERRQLQGMGLDASARWAEVGDVRIASVGRVANDGRLYATVSSPPTIPTAP